MAEPVAASANWTSIDLLFLLETTPYDGAWDRAEPMGDSCTPSTYYLCEEASLLQTFATNAGAIAQSIAAAHPGVEVRFGLVDYFSTGTLGFDDLDSSQYHVDVGQFTPSATFGAAVNDSLLNSSSPVLYPPSMYMPDSDLADNYLTSDSITALYFALFGAGLNWSSDAHHVLAVLGSTAPQDPHYPENYCVSPGGPGWTSTGSCFPQTCEPTATFGSVTSPACVGWVHPPTNGTTGSIAGYAQSSPSCAGSAGGTCTIDAIDVWDTPTDPYSPGWPVGAGQGGGPGGNNTTLDSWNILQAGCDIANATGGSWDGPAYYACNFSNGTLTYSPMSSKDSSLLASFVNLGFGVPGPNYFASAADAPMLQIVLAPGVVLAPDPRFSAFCDGPSPPLDCPQAPVLSAVGEITVLRWNWSSDNSTNLLRAGDHWSVGFDLVAAAGAAGSLPIYLCDSSECRDAGGGPVQGLFSSLSGVLGRYPGAPAWSASLPLAEVSIKAPSMPSASLQATPRIGEAPLSTTFLGIASGGVTPETVLLDFGDGSWSNGDGWITHLYEVGAYTATLRVVDALGRIVDTSVSIDALPALQTWISANVTAGPAPLTVGFSANAVPGEPPYKYAWDFGDGEISQLASPDHEFKLAGSWNVTLAVTDELGYTEVSSQWVLVLAPASLPPVEVTPTPGDHSITPVTPSGTPAYLPYAGLVLAGLAAAVVIGLLASRNSGRPPIRKGPSPHAPAKSR